MTNDFAIGGALAQEVKLPVNDCGTTFSVNGFAGGVEPSLAKGYRNGLGYIGGSIYLNGILRIGCTSLASSVIQHTKTQWSKMEPL